MAHGLASQLGGALTITSTPGLGTNVELWLPETERIPEAEMIVAETQVNRGRGLVLLVDDEERVRLSTSDMLNELGYEVREASTAEEGLKIIQSGEKIDLVLSDHLMPGMTGADLARALQALRPGLPILIISGYAESEGLAPDLPRLTKPFRRNELGASIASLA
jgi:CheY-like chemotaxis protein